MEEISSAELPPEVDVLVVPKANHLDIVETVEEFKDLNLNYYQNHYNFNMQELSKVEGIGLPMKMITDRIVVNMVGSRLMDDVLTGRCDNIHFEDFMKHRKRTKLSELEKLKESL